LDHTNAHIVTSTFTIDDGEEITLEKGSVWELHDKCREGEPSEEWILSKGDYVSQVYVPVALANKHIRHYWTYYQEQFDHLDKDKAYFGQLRPHYVSDFSIMENGQEVFYRKIDEYVDTEGKKYNAFKYLNTRQNSYWEIDDIDDYEDKEFLYLAPDVEITSKSLFSYGEKYFCPPTPIVVNEYFLLFPKMLDVVDYGFRKQPLTPELRKVFEEYDNYKSEQENYFQSPEDLLITEVRPRLEEKLKEEEEARIMQGINREVELFKRELIRVRLKR
jgi:hypothetical protein